MNRLRTPSFIKPNLRITCLICLFGAVVAVLADGPFVARLARKELALDMVSGAILISELGCAACHGSGRTVLAPKPGPWADFQTEKCRMQVPSSWIRKLDDAGRQGMPLVGFHTGAAQPSRQVPDPEGEPAAVSLDLERLDRLPADHTKEVKVFILMGQSNMVGMGDILPEDKPGTLVTLTKKQKKYPFLLDNDGQWRI